MTVKRFFTYILKCADDTLYTGWTTDVEKRITAHNSGAGARYTRNRGPVQLLIAWEYENKVEAMRSEFAIKKLSRRQKEALIVQGRRPQLTQRLV